MDAEDGVTSSFMGTPKMMKPPTFLVDVKENVLKCWKK